MGIGQATSTRGPDPDGDGPEPAPVLRNGDHAWTVALVGPEGGAPAYAVAVVVEHGGGGSTAAAPIARDVTLQALYGGTPPLTAYPTKDRGRIRTQQEALERLVPQREITRRDRA